MAKIPTTNLPAGEVKVSPHGIGWFLIEIGRGRYTKRFNLSAAEATILLHELEQTDLAASLESVSRRVR